MNVLSKINRLATNSLKEGLEEILILDRLGLSVELGSSLSITNCIENSQLEVGNLPKRN